MDPLSLGITVFLIGFVVLGSVLLSRRFIPRILAVDPPAKIPSLGAGLIASPSRNGSDSLGLLLVKTGGRVVFTNQTARDWFGLLKDEPNLERLARWTKPEDIFMGLCAAEGQARFFLHGHSIDGWSSFLPYEGGTAILVSLQHSPDPLKSGQIAAESTHPPAGSLQMTPQALQIIASAIQSAASGADVEGTVQHILEGIEHLIPADFNSSSVAEITLWDEASRRFTAYRLMGLPGVDRRYLKSSDVSRLSGGEPESVQENSFSSRWESGTQIRQFTGILEAQRSPLLINDTDSQIPENPPDVPTGDVPTGTASRFSSLAVKSFLGIPLLVAGKLVGTLELSSLSKNAFTQNDLENLSFLSVSAALALSNALLLKEQQRRSAEFNGLTQLTQAARSPLPGPDEYHNLYERLVKSIQPILKVESLGFWIWNPDQNSLDAQEPFIGFSSDFTSLHHLTILPGSPAEVLLNGREVIVAQNAVEDERFKILGLNPHAQVAGIQSAVLAPLVVSGRLLGYLQAADKRDGSPFHEDDVNLLEIISGLVSSILENLVLFQQVQESAQSDLLLNNPAQLIHQLNQQTSWMRSGLQSAGRIASAYAEPTSQLIHPDGQSSRSWLYNLLGKEILRLLHAAQPDAMRESGLVLVAAPSPTGLRLVETVGEPPEALSKDINLEVLLGQRNPLRSILHAPLPEHGDTSVGDHPAVGWASNLDETSEWVDSPLLQALGARSFICFPILAGDPQNIPTPGQPAPVEAAVLAVLSSSLPAHVLDDGEIVPGIFDLLGRQTGQALHHLDLQAEVNRRLKEVDILLDFSRQLGSLDPAGILNTLLDSTRKLIPATHAGMVALFDPSSGYLVPQAAAGYSDNQRILEITYQTARAGQPGSIESGVPAAPIPLPGQAFTQGRALRVDEVDFPLHYPLSKEDVIRYRDATHGRLPVSSMVLPIGTGTPVEGQGGAAPPLGVLVLENFGLNAAFTAEDQALITSLVQQTALYLENARAKADVEALYQSASARAAQLEALTGVAAAMTSSLNTQALIGSVLDQASAVIAYDTATLWIRQGDRLTVRAVRGFPPDPSSDSAEERVGLSVVASESFLLREMINTGRPILSPDVREDARFSSLVPPRYLSWLGVPLISKGAVAGVIALEKAEPGYYTSDQIQAVNTFAGLVSVAMENANLYEESLARAAELDRRAERLALLHRLSTELGSSLDVTYILQLTLQELLLAVSGAGGEAFIFDAAGEILLQAEVPAQDIPAISAPGYWGAASPGVLPIVVPDAHIFEHMRESRGVLILQDIQAEPEWFLPSEPGKVLPDRPGLSEYLAARVASIHGSAGIPGQKDRGDQVPLEARALLVLPLATGNDLHGVLFIHRDWQPHPLSGPFLPEEVELARTISNQAGVAVQNAALFQETQWLFAETRQRSAELATLFDLGVNISQVLDQQKLIDITFENVQHLMQVDSVGLVIEVEDPISGNERRLDAQAVEGGKRIGPVPLPPDSQSLSRWVLSTGQPLLIGDLLREKKSLPASGYTIGEKARSWLGVPLVVRGAVVGVLATQSDECDHFGDSHLRLLGQIGNQLAVALDNARLFATVQSYAASLEQRVEARSAELSARTAQLAREHQRTQTLLGIITELSTSLDMDIVLNRTLALIIETVGADHSVIMLAPMLGADPQTASEPTLYLRASLGKSLSTILPTPKGGRPTFLRPDEGLAGWAISSRQSALIADLRLDPRWSLPTPTSPNSTQADAPIHRSAIAVPLLVGEETLGALLLFHSEPDHFSMDQLDLVQATAKQIAVAINNARLYTLIRNQAERLGELLRYQHIETSRSKAILEAVADGVLVTGANRVITLFNASAERILGLRKESVIGLSLEHFSGLFGAAGQTWINTIRNWSEDPTSIPLLDPETDQSFAEEYGVLAAYTEQIELEEVQSGQARTVSVHLSPVQLRNEFLGTVSTFRDITHQVVVDRLKSEFVATVSHELRTPLTSIKGYVEVLLMGAAGEMSEQQTRFLEIVRTNTERLAALVNDLLDISRIEAGRVNLTPQPVDLCKLAHEVAGDFERRSKEEHKRLEIEVACTPDLPCAQGDKERLRQVLDNLMENAYSYTPVDGSVLLALHPSGQAGQIQVDVQDNGIGISPEDQPRIFERFFRGKNPVVLATSGTGLGLSIVRRLVEMHGGRIWLESPTVAATADAPGRGSKFSFTIPAYRGQDG